MNADIEIWLSLKTDFFYSKNRNNDRKKSPKPQTSKVRLLRNRNFREYNLLPFAERKKKLIGKFRLYCWEST